VSSASRPGRYERAIVVRIMDRTCSRAEWHALRRLRARRRTLGLEAPSLDVLLAGVVVAEDWRRGCEAVLPIMRRLMRPYTDLVREPAAVIRGGARKHSGFSQATLRFRGTGDPPP
jgi:hypothetical protein